MMNFDPRLLAKTDPRLRDALLNLKGDEKLRVVMSLAQEKGEKLTTQPLTPSQFPSREAYREALIAQRKQQLAEGTVGETIEALKNLSLTTHGGTTSSVVVVEGTAKQILKSLDLSGVRSASLDQFIRIEPTPIDPRIVEHLANLSLEILPGDKEQIYRASQQYVRTYYKRYGTLQVLGMRKPVKLDEIYTHVQLLSERDVLKFADLQGLEQYFRETQRRFDDQKTCKELGIKVANEQQYLMVLGAPGAGKSTFLRKIGLEALKGNQGKFEHFCIPVFIELKQFNQQEIYFNKVICEIFKDCGFLKAEDYTEKALSSGKLLILLDGLDEVPSKNSTYIINSIQEFIQTNKNNRFMISCRTAAYGNHFTEFKNVEIADFDDKQIEQFINNWFQSEVDKRAKTAEKCWQELQKNQGAKELARSPVWLTFFCLVYDESQGLPKNRSYLYRDALQILLKKWAAEKRLERDPIYQRFTTELEEILLAEIAYKAFKNNQIFFKQQELTQQIKTFLAENLNAPQQLDGEAVLNAIAIQQGILVERAENIYSFSHLTLQEYLAAQYIVNNNLIEQLVINHVTDIRWKEVFLLVAGLMQEQTGADRLLLLMEKQALNYLNTPTGQHLIPLLRWTEDMTTGSPADLKPVAKRAVAIAFAYVNTNALALAYPYVKANALALANAYANALALANAYANVYTNANANANTLANALAYALANGYALANARTNAIEYFLENTREISKLPAIFNNVDLQGLMTKLEQLKANIPNNNQPLKVHQKFAQTLIQTWLSAFHLTVNTIDLSKKELDEIDKHYSYIYWLMLQCKEAAARLTIKTWEEIEDRMFRVVDS